MSESRYEKFWPGAVLKVKLEIRHVPMRLHDVGVVFRHEKQPEIELYAGGEPNAAGREGHVLPGGVGESSVAELALEVPARAVPGVYRVNRAWVETYAGHDYRYQGEELGTMAEVGFEVIEEPDAKPELTISFTD